MKNEKSKIKNEKTPAKDKNVKSKEGIVFSKADAKNFICDFLRNCVVADIAKNTNVESAGKRTATEIHTQVERIFGVGSSTVRRYLKEMVSENTIAISTRATEGVRTVVNVFSYVPPVKEEEPKTETPAEIITEEVTETVNENPAEEELTVDENDTDMPPVIADIPIRSERTKNVRIAYSRTESILDTLRIQKATPTQIIEASNQAYVKEGGADNIRKQTQVYKIVVSALIEFGIADIDLLGYLLIKQ